MEVRLRLTVVDPPPGALCRIQLGKTGSGQFLDPVEGTTFEFTEKQVRQGPPKARFLYITWGPPWQRRAKVSLMNLPPGEALHASIAGTGRDGGPCCASVPFLRAWSPETGE